MNFMIVLGLLVSIISVVLGVPGIQSTFHIYLDPYSFVMVFGATVGSAMMSASFKDFWAMIQILTGWVYLRNRSVSHYDVLLKLVEVAEKASRNGKQSVLDLGKGFGDGFLDRALTLMGSGLEMEFVRRTLETDITEEKRRHASIAALIRSMGSFAPMFGMMGTVIGIVMLLQNVTDINSVVSGMSLALITTLYGIILSAIFFIPITNKLKYLSTKDSISKEMIMEGVLAIMDNQIPLKVEKMLMSYISTRSKERLLQVKQ